MQLCEWFNRHHIKYILRIPSPRLADINTWANDVHISELRRRAIQKY